MPWKVGYGMYWMAKPCEEKIKEKKKPNDREVEGFAVEMKKYQGVETEAESEVLCSSFW